MQGIKILQSLVKIDNQRVLAELENFFKKISRKNKMLNNFSCY